MAEDSRNGNTANSAMGRVGGTEMSCAKIKQRVVVVVVVERMVEECTILFLMSKLITLLILALSLLSLSLAMTFFLYCVGGGHF